MASAVRPLAVVTGASTGIGLELAKCCAEDGFDLIIAADEPAIKEAAIIHSDWRGQGRSHRSRSRDDSRAWTSSMRP